MSAPDPGAPWPGTVLRLPGGQVLLAGSALLDVARALQGVQRAARSDGIEPPDRVRWLLAQVLAAAAESTTAAPGSAALPQMEDLSPSLHEDLISSEEAASMLGCKPRNVRDLAVREVLRSGRKRAGRLLFERSEIEAEARRRAEAHRPQEDRCA